MKELRGRGTMFIERQVSGSNVHLPSEVELKRAFESGRRTIVKFNLGKKTIGHVEIHPITGLTHKLQAKFRLWFGSGEIPSGLPQETRKKMAKYAHTIKFFPAIGWKYNFKNNGFEKKAA